MGFLQEVNYQKQVIKIFSGFMLMLLSKRGSINTDCRKGFKNSSIYQNQVIYRSQELKLLTESMTYGHSDLRTHLLTITNLIVREFRSAPVLNKEREHVLAHPNPQKPFPPEMKGLSPDRLAKGFEGEDSSQKQGK